MKKISVVLFVVLLMATSMVLFACSTGEIDAAKDVLDDEQELETVPPEKELEKITYPDSENTIYFARMGEKYESYNTKDELLEVSANVVTGKCISTTTDFREHGFMYTVCEVLVDESFKGDITQGSTIKVVEFGGKCTVNEFIEASGIKEKDFYESSGQEDMDGTIVSGIDGYYPMNEGENVLLFLATSGTYNDIENVYGVMGSGEGKLYKITDTSYARPNPGEVTGGYTNTYSMQSAIDKSDLIIDIKDL